MTIEELKEKWKDCKLTYAKVDFKNYKISEIKIIRDALCTFDDTASPEWLTLVARNAATNQVVYSTCFALLDDSDASLADQQLQALCDKGDTEKDIPYALNYYYDIGVPVRDSYADGKACVTLYMLNTSFSDTELEQYALEQLKNAVTAQRWLIKEFYNEADAALAKWETQ